MTYSLTEKEEILYERQIDELFNLTEVTPLVGDKELKTYTDPATGQAYEVDPATAVRLKKQMQQLTGRIGIGGMNILR